MASLPYLPVRGVNFFPDGLNLGLPMRSGMLPMMSETGDDISFAGIRGAVNIMTTAEALEMKVTADGIQPDILAQFAGPTGTRRTYTILAALVDELSDDTAKRSIPVQATAIGRLSAEVQALEGGSIGSTEYTVKSITKYTLSIGGREICRFDLRMGGWLDADGLQLDVAQTIGLNA